MYPYIVETCNFHYIVIVKKSKEGV